MKFLKPSITSLVLVFAQIYSLTFAANHCKQRAMKDFFANTNEFISVNPMCHLSFRYDPQISIPLVIDTEQERAFFIKSATYYIMQKSRIKLNPKKLYMVGSCIFTSGKTANVLKIDHLGHRSYSATNISDDEIHFFGSIILANKLFFLLVLGLKLKSCLKYVKFLNLMLNLRNNAIKGRRICSSRDRRCRSKFV